MSFPVFETGVYTLGVGGDTGECDLLIATNPAFAGGIAVIPETATGLLAGGASCRESRFRSVGGRRGDICNHAVFVG